jgi:hypothetical protein
MEIRAGSGSTSSFFSRPSQRGVRYSIWWHPGQRVFAPGFAREQIRQNLKDLERCAKEWSRQPQSND